MINQIQSIKTKTGNLPTINKALLQARHIQARLNGRLDQPVDNHFLWNPINSGPFHVPITRWIE